MSLLGVDVGTSEVKAALFDAAGECLGTAATEYPASFPEPGFAELDPDLLWSVVTGTIRKLQSRVECAPVCAVAFSSHGESFVAVDANQKALHPIILNIDSRAAAEMMEYVAAFGRESLYQSTGLPPHPMYTLPKIAWLKKHRPAVFGKAKQFLCIHDYLLLRGTGEACIDSSLASRTLAYDINKGGWHAGLLAHAGLETGRMARVVPGGVAVGKTRETAMAETGLPADTVWVSGGHDQACTSIGAGGLELGTLVDGTGTFECISIVSRTPLAAAAAELNIPCERHCAPDLYLSLAYAPGGVILKWFRDQFARDLLAQPESPTSSYDLLLSGIPNQPTGLFVLPYLLGTGTPWLDATARGVIQGFTLNTSREALVRAALEGVTYEMCWNLEALERLGIRAERIMAVGGGAKSAAWLQLKADIFGREVTVIPGEAACRGAAICAGVGAGVFRTFDEGIHTVVHRGAVFQPRAEAHRQYSDAFGEYKDLAKRLYGFELPASGRQTQVLGS